MDEDRVARLRRVVGARISRRGVIGMAAVAAIPFQGSAAAQVAGGDAAALVRQFYELIDAYQYADAYALLGASWRSEQSLDRFTRGFHDTAFVQCRTTSTVATGLTASVAVELISWHNDGSIAAYAGVYVVGPEQGGLTIIAGDNTATSVPPGTPPLCGVADLDLALGSWQGAAGSREGSIQATNRGGATCALGGSPRVRLTDRNGDTLVSTSEGGSPPEAIIVAPGQTAQAPIRFSNWCGATDGAPALTVELPGAPATAPVDAAAGTIAYPPCNGPAQPATLDVKGWTR